MSRAHYLAIALAACVSTAILGAASLSTTPAFAEEAQKPAMENIFTSDQARKHLMHMGYTNISNLEKDESGKWYGTATKDGKTVAVAVDVKGEVSPK